MTRTIVDIAARCPRCPLVHDGVVRADIAARAGWRPCRDGRPVVTSVAPR